MVTKFKQQIGDVMTLRSRDYQKTLKILFGKRYGTSI